VVAQPTAKVLFAEERSEASHRVRGQDEMLSGVKHDNLSWKQYS
jgi:hypothetical protein